MDGSADGGAVAALLPRGQVDVLRPLGQAGVTGRGAGGLLFGFLPGCGFGCEARGRGGQRLGRCGQGRVMGQTPLVDGREVGRDGRRGRHGPRRWRQRRRVDLEVGRQRRVRARTAEHLGSRWDLRVLAVLAVDGHDEVVAGAGGGHVEQSESLVMVHLLLEGLGELELGRAHALLQLDGPRRGRWEPHLDAAREGPHLGGEAGQHHDRELQALGPVDGEDAHCLVVALGEHGLDDTGALGRLAFSPAEILAQGHATRLLPRSALVEHEAQAPPQVARPALDHGQLHEAALTHDALEHLAG